MSTILDFYNISLEEAKSIKVGDTILNIGTVKNVRYDVPVNKKDIHFFKFTLSTGSNARLGFNINGSKAK